MLGDNQMKQLLTPRSCNAERSLSGKFAAIGLIGLLLAAAGCASQSSLQSAPRDSSDAPIKVTLSENEGRVLFESSSIRDQRDSVLLNASEKFGQPQCQVFKTGLVNSRKASTIEDCTFELSSQSLLYAGAPIQNIRYRFLDGRLLQMKVVFERTLSDDAVALRSSLQRDLQLTTANEASNGNEWFLAYDQVTVMQASDQVSGVTGAALQISDAKITPLVVGL